MNKIIMDATKINLLLCCDKCEKPLQYTTTEEIDTPAQNKFESAYKIFITPCEECVKVEQSIELFINNKKEESIQLSQKEKYKNM